MSNTLAGILGTLIAIVLLIVLADQFGECCILR